MLKNQPKFDGGQAIDNLPVCENTLIFIYVMIILIKSGSPEVYIIAGIVTWAYK
jgi:hypothetical protein